jgi:hypothetical protein
MPNDIEATQKQNDEILVELRKHYPSAPRLTMTASNNLGFRGLHLHLGLGKDHYVNDGIRDLTALLEIVKGFMAGHTIGMGDGMNVVQARLHNALGFDVDSDTNAVTYSGN